MFLIRDVREADLDGLSEVAAHLDSVNLPDDRSRLAEIIAASRASFAGERDVADRRFVFVLVEADPGDGAGRVLGTSMIFAQHGSRRAPHVYFDVLEEERYSSTLDRHVVHQILRIGYNYKGLTEVGGLVLRPELRRHPARLGKLLSYVRFLYLALHRPIFRDEVVSELMPPLEPDGTSLLWEALGRKFTGLSYQEADRLSQDNKEFIRTLFPEEPIYATLLPPAVQAVIGQVGPGTKGVEKMLRQIGFEYAHRIDPFDGGPHFHARIDDLALVRGVRRVRAAEAGAGGPALAAAEPPAAPPPLLVAAEGGGSGGETRFRATPVWGAVPVAGGELALPEEARLLLGVPAGTEVACLPLDRSEARL
jgi:arginine N-succinyltransferase